MRSVLSRPPRASVLVATAILSLTAAGPVAAEPFFPADDAQVLERLPFQSSADPRMIELRQLRAELAEEPGNLELALRLARRYLELGRSEGDPRFQGYAQAALARWWAQPQPPPGILMLRATVRQNRHDFDGALDDLARLLRLQPRNAQAWLTRAVILMVQGDHAGALDSCQPLRRSHPLLALGCMASAASLSGRAEPGYEVLKTALASATSAAPEDRIWALTSLAEIAARLGREDAAEKHFEEALALGLRDVYLLGAYADFLLDNDRPEEVLELLEDESRSDGLLLRLALAEARLQGSPGLEAHVASLRARFAETRLRGENLHLGAEARFRLELLGEPAAALRLAQENWKVQREPADARRVLEAALAAGNPAAAWPVVEWIEESGLEDVRLVALSRRLEEVKR